MNKELQDRAWAALPKETRKQIRQDYLCGLYNIKNLLMDLFGLHNLTSATEPEEMLCVERKKVQELIKELRDKASECVRKDAKYMALGHTVTTLYELFGTKCLPVDDIPDLSNSQKIGNFCVGDKVRIKNGDAKGAVATIVFISEKDAMCRVEFAWKAQEVDLWYSEYDIEPYGKEPEATGNPFLDRELDEVIKQLSKIQNRLHTERVLKQISKQISKQED